MKKSPYDFARFTSLSPHVLHTFSRCISHDSSHSKPPPRDTAHQGKVSRSAQKRIEFLVNCLVLHSLDKKYWSDQASELRWFKINFTTLTLPSKQLHEDKEIVHRCLNNFLMNCRNIHGLKNYLWKAETQSNGNLHFHITSDCYLPYKSIRQLWIQALQPLGYIDNFSSKFGHRNPPCTEVKKVNQIKKLGRYLSKYFSKNEADRRPVTCRIWSASASLQQLKPLVVQEGTDLYNDLRKLDLSSTSVYFSQYVSSYYGEILRYYLPAHRPIIDELLAPMRGGKSCKYSARISQSKCKQLGLNAQTVEQARTKPIAREELLIF